MPRQRSTSTNTSDNAMDNYHSEEPTTSNNARRHNSSYQNVGASKRSDFSKHIKDELPAGHGFKRKRTLEGLSSETLGKVSKRKAEGEYSGNVRTAAVRTRYQNMSEIELELYRATDADQKAEQRAKDKVRKSHPEYQNATSAQQAELLDNAVNECRLKRIKQGKHTSCLHLDYEEMEVDEECVIADDAVNDPSAMADIEAIDLTDQQHKEEKDKLLSVHELHKQILDFYKWRTGWREACASLYQKLRQLNSGPKFFWHQFELRLLRSIRRLIRRTYENHAYRHGFESKWYMLVPRSHGVLEHKGVPRNHGIARCKRSLRTRPCPQGFAFRPKCKLSKRRLQSLDDKIMCLGEKRLRGLDEISKSPKTFFSNEELAVWRNLAAWYFNPEEGGESESVIELPGPKEWYAKEPRLNLNPSSKISTSSVGTIISQGKWRTDTFDYRGSGLETGDIAWVDGYKRAWKMVVMDIGGVAFTGVPSDFQWLVDMSGQLERVELRCM